MAQKSLELAGHPHIEGDSKYGFRKVTFIPSDTRQANAVNGTMEYDESDDAPVFYNGSAWVTLGVASTAGTGLDGAYDLNKTITVDSATVRLTGSNVDVLTVTQSANDDNIIITKTGAGAGNLIKFTNAGTGDDIQGTSDTWAVTAAGVATFTTITGTDLTMTGTQTITLDDTSGVGINIEGDSISTGTAMEIDVDGGTAATILDLQDSSSSVFVVRGGDGQLTITGDAKDTDAIVITDGDITLTDGDLDITSGQLSLISDQAGDGLTVKDTTGGGNYDLVYLNGFTSTGSGHILSIAQGAATRTGHAVDISMGTTAVAMSAINIACTGGTRTKPIIAIDSDGTAEDFIDMVTSVAFSGNMLSMTADTSAATGNFIYINNDSGTSMEAINIDDEANVADTILVDTAANIGAGKAQLHLVASAGALNATANAIYVNWTADVDANTPIMVRLDADGRDINAMTIDSDAVTDVVLINGGGVLTDGEAVLALTNDGNLASGGNLLSVDMGGTPADETACAVEITAAKDCQALAIATSAATASGIVFTGSGATADNTAVFEVNWGSSTPANAGANLVRINGTDATMSNKPVLCEILDNSTSVGLSVSTASTEDMVSLIGIGATGDNFAVLDVTWGAVTPGNAGANLVRIDASSATTSAKPVLLEVYDNGVSVGMSVSTASIEDMVTFIGTGDIGADKAVVDITSTGTLNAGGNLLRLDGSGATTTSKPPLLEIYDNDVAVGAYISTASVENMVELVPTGATTNGNAALAINSSAAIAAGGSLLNLTYTGTPANNTVSIVDLVCSQDCLCMDVVTSAATTDAVRITGVGAINDDKALLQIAHGTGDIASGGSLIKLTAASTGTAGAYGMTIDCSGSNVEALWVEAGKCVFEEAISGAGVREHISVELSAFTASSTVYIPIMAIPTDITVTKVSLCAKVIPIDNDGTCTVRLVNYDASTTTDDEIVAAWNAEGLVAKIATAMTVVTASSINVLSATDFLFVELTSDTGIDTNWEDAILTIEYYYT